MRLQDAVHPDPVARMDRTLVVVGRHLDATVAARMVPVLADMADFAAERIAEPRGFVVEAGGRRIVRRADQATIADTGTSGQHAFRCGQRDATLHVMDHRLDVDHDPALLAQAAAVALVALGRIAAGDRLVAEDDFAVVTRCATELVLGPPMEIDPTRGFAMPLSSLDGISIGTPWHPSSANLPTGHPRARDAVSRHWSTGRGLSALGVWMLDGRLVIGGMRRMRPEPEGDPVALMRLHARDAAVRERVAAMGLLDALLDGEDA